MNNYHKIAQLGRLAAMEKMGQRAFFKPKPKKVLRPPNQPPGGIYDTNKAYFDKVQATGRPSADDLHHKWMNDGTPKRYDPRTKKWRHATDWERMERRVGIAARLGALGGVGYMGGKVVGDHMFGDPEQEQIDDARIMKAEELLDAGHSESSARTRLSEPEPSSRVIGEDFMQEK